MNNFEVEKALERLKILVDTREQETARFHRRMKAVGLPYERRKLDAGDYSAVVEIDGEEVSFESDFAIERKMSLEELCSCFGQQRDRFRREFERAAASGTKIYLLVEGGSWDKIYNWDYVSKMHPNALISSLNAYRARYNMQLDFCSSSKTGDLIKEISKREAKERLTNGKAERMGKSSPKD